MAAKNRPHQVKFRIDEHERERIMQNMEASGIKNQSAYLRKMALNGFIVQLDTSCVTELTALLRRANANINQIAARANETGNVYAADIEDLRERVDGLWTAAETVIRTFAKMSGELSAQESDNEDKSENGESEDTDGDAYGSFTANDAANTPNPANINPS